MKELIGKEFALSTYKKYSTCLMHLRDFIKGKYNQNHFSVKSVNLEFIKRFEHYLKYSNDPETISASCYV